MKTLLILLLSVGAAIGQSMLPFVGPAWRVASAAESTALVSSFNTGSLSSRNDYTGFIGCIWTNDSGSSVTITHLGAWSISGNTDTSVPVHITDESGNSHGSVNIDNTAVSDGFVYAELASPVAVTNNGVRYILLEVALSGDSWYDKTSNDYVTETVGTLEGAVHTDGDLTPPFNLSDGMRFRTDKTGYGITTFKYTQ